MKHEQFRDLDRRRVDKLLSKTKHSDSAGSRIEVLSRQFLTYPYITNLIGSSQEPEIFVASLDGFDCVTYVETILALSRASSTGEFLEWLRKIRYDRGRVDWKRRNHYMTNWIHNNAKLGLVRPLRPRGIATITKHRELDVVPQLPAVRSRFVCVPKTSLHRFLPHVQTGDLIFFASTRPHLDVFHCGILVRDGDRLLMRHAARSRERVIEQELDDFLKANRMAGIIVARPTEGVLQI
jgi:hypothetical protein